MNITPDTVPEHGRLEMDVNAFLAECGFLTGSATYHDVMDAPVVARLQSVLTPTTLRVRTRADRLAIHKVYELAFEWESKTHVSHRLHDMTLEAYPLCAHLADADLGSRCLYVYRDIERGYDVGFWVHDLQDIPIRTLHIPSRWRGHERWLPGWIGDLARRWMPDIPIQETRWNSGSGDPYIIIDESVVRDMANWRDLIRATMLE